jgi:hypothetical protein
LSASSVATGGDTARLDAIMLEPVVSRLVLGGDQHGTALLSNASDQPQKARVTLDGVGSARIESYDGSGHLVAVGSSSASTLSVTVPARGFTFVRR